MFSFLEASRELGIPLQFPNPAVQAAGASIDTRTLAAGDLFVALKGTRQDGHTYLEEAFRKGAAGSLMDQKVFDSEKERFSGPRGLFQNLLTVRDTEKSLQDLALWNRNRFSVAAVGVTGSVGKTSTKEFLSYLLGLKFSVLSNRGNFNNHLGLPLTLLQLDISHRFAVAELGANHAGEIRALSHLLKPAAAILTQVSPAHLEGFGSLDAIYNAKLELLESLPPGSPAVLPDDDLRLIEKARRLNLHLILVGKSVRADCRLTDCFVKDAYVHFELNGNWRFAFPGLAPFLARNAAMAAAMAEALGLRLEEVPGIWEGIALPSGRFQERLIGDGIRIIDDGYNANPASFEKALETFQILEAAGKKILVFSDMLELGAESEKYHDELGRKIAACSLDFVAAYGERAKRSLQALHRENPSLEARHFKSSRDVADFLITLLRPGDVVLMKASRGMKVEEVWRSLEEKLSALTKG